MPKWALCMGALLVLTGLLGYYGGDQPEKGTVGAAVSETTSATGTKATDGQESSSASKKTALIPALVGMALIICGTVGFLPDARKHAMHVAAGIALLGFLAAAGRLGMTASKLIQGDFSRASLFLIAMALICGAYVFLSVQSFRAARRARMGEASGA